MDKLKTFLWLFLIVILGFSLRWYDLATESLWNDEAFSVHHASLGNVSEVIEEVSMTEGAPAGSYILLHYWIRWFGLSEVAVRSLSVLFGVLAILCLFFLVRLFFSDAAALLSSLFLATSMLQVLFSQEARLYSLFTFLTICTSYILALIFIRTSRKEKTVFWWVVYFIVVFLAFYVSYTTLFLVLFYSILLLLYWEKFDSHFRSTFIWIHSILALLLFCFYFFFGQIFVQRFLSFNKGLTNSLISKHLPAFLAQFGLFFYTLPLLLFLCFFFFFFLLKKKHTFLQFSISDTLFFVVVSFWAVFYVYLCFYTLTLFGIPLTQNPITQSYFLIRHSFFLAPLLYVYAAYKICTMRRKVFAVGVMIVILLVNIVALSAYYSQTTKAPWREAMSYIQERSSSPNLLLLDKGGFSNEYLLRYYYTSTFSLVKITSSEEWRKLDKMTDTEVWQAIGKREEFWLILYKNTSTKDFYKNLLDTRYISDDSTDFKGIKIYHYRTRNI